VGHLNVNSVINKVHEIETIIHNLGTPFHIFGISEARVTNKISDNDVTIPGYNLEKRLPKRKLETGIVAYTSSSLNTKRCHELEQYDIECIWLEVKLKHTAPILVGIIYRNPEECSVWNDNFNLMIDAVMLKSKEFILLGDFNVDLIKQNTTWLNMIADCNLTQLINTPTRVTPTSKTLIDHIYTSHPYHVVEVCVPPFGCSDHFPVCLTWRKKGAKIPRATHKTISYRSFKTFNEPDFISDLSMSPINEIYNITDPDAAIQFWHEQFMLVYNKHAPLYTKRVKHYKKPEWLDEELQEAIRTRDYLKKKGYEIDYKAQRNRVTAMKRAKMKTFFNKMVECNKNTKQIWKAINQLTNKSRQPQPTISLSPQTLNEHFTTVKERVITVDTSGENNLDRLQTFCHSKVVRQTKNIPLMTVTDVYKALNQLKQTNTRGLDGIDNKILKISAAVISDSLTYIYNLCITKSYFPFFFKQAKVIPLYKSGPTNDPNNYRPISILSSLSKPIERHIHSHLLNHLMHNDLLNQNQSGFRPNHSCHTALTSMVEKWSDNINDNKLNGVLFIDFAKAFDVIDHGLLLRKLNYYHLSSDCISFLNSFISARHQSVCVNALLSDQLPVHYGVPQGSVLGPLLFSIYVNDLPLNISNQCEMFADDTTVHATETTTEALSASLQKSAQELQTWTQMNHMSINPVKTEVMLVTTRQKRQVLPAPLPPISVCNQTIKEVQSHTLLGVTIDNNLSWHDHISKISKTIAKKSYQLTRIKHFLNSQSRKLFYSAHIQSSIDYASTLWDSASANAMKPLQRVQKRAIKAVLLKTKIHNEDYRSIEILPLQKRLQYNKLLFMSKILSGRSSRNLLNRFSLNTSRNYTKLNVPIPRLDIFKTCLLYSGSVLWNALPQSIKEQMYIQKSFKKRLFRHLLP
jgi:hypothetical protein